jgi:hypothetical protein
MTNPMPLNGQQIIIRQEVILPVGWAAPPLPPAEPLIQQPPSVIGQRSQPQTVTRPCGPCAGARGSETSVPVQTNPSANAVQVYLTQPTYSSTCLPTPNGLFQVRGHSDTSGIGARKICVKCYETDKIPSEAELAVPPADAKCIEENGTGSTLNPDWYIDDVPIAAPGVLNTVISWSQFPGSPTWFDPRATFIPCAESGVGMNQVMSAPLSAARTPAEVPPPRAMSLTLPNATTSVRLTFDEFCSTPEQPLWLGVDSCGKRWGLKACRYGDRLIGILSDRTETNFSVVWITDDFQLHSTNQLHREGSPNSTAVVQPA